MSIGKIKSHALLLRGTIEPHEKIIHAFLEKHTPDAIVYTPPTVARHVQFRDILKSVIEKNNNTQYISAEKVTDPSRVFQPQKELRGQARITNADASIMVTGAKNLKKMKRIVIFDDNFTTGATMNAIALKIRSQGFYGTITAITICGNFTYIPGETDAGDV